MAKRSSKGPRRPKVRIAVAVPRPPVRHVVHHVHHMGPPVGGLRRPVMPMVAPPVRPLAPPMARPPMAPMGVPPVGANPAALPRAGGLGVPVGPGAPRAPMPGPMGPMGPIRRF